MSGSKHWKELDGLRGILAVGVVLLHFGFNSFAERTLGWRGINFGLAVDVFFVLSGYVLAHSARKGVDRYAFAYRRLRRLAPIYFVTSLIAVLVAPERFQTLDLIAASPIIGGEPVNFPSWSITWEFYLPVLAVVFGVNIAPRFDNACLAIGIGISSIACWLMTATVDIGVVRAFAGLATGYFLYRAGYAGRSFGLLPCFALGLIFAGSLSFPLVGLALPITAIWCVLSGRNSTTILSAAPCQFFGHISYSLYMVHIPVLFMMGRLLGPGIDSNPIAKVGGILLSVGIAAFLTKFVERPMMTRTAAAMPAP